MNDDQFTTDPAQRLAFQVRQALNPDIEPWAQGCSGDCHQGRLPCKVPEACWRHIEDQGQRSARAVGLMLLWAILVVCVVILAVLLA